MKKMILSLTTLLVLGTSTGYCNEKVDHKDDHSKSNKQEMVMKNHDCKSDKHDNGKCLDCKMGKDIHKKGGHKHHKEGKHGDKHFDCKIKEHKKMM